MPRPPPVAATDVQGILCTASCRGLPVVIGHATDGEIASLRDALAAPVTVHDVLELWSLVAIRWSGGQDATVHALGWRAHHRDTLITSALQAVHIGRSQVSTSGGRAYRLLEPDAASLEPQLRRHLLSALRLRGFDDVRG